MLLEYLVLTLLGIWFICSVLYQIEPVRQSRVFDFDILGIIPSFRFFAPHPVSHDLKVYARGLNNANQQSNWYPIHKTERGKFSFLWNPIHRERKAIYDIYEELEPFRQAPKIWHLSAPYIILLNRSQHVVKHKQQDFTKVQFCITCYAGYEDQTQNILFLSNEHELDQ